LQPSSPVSLQLSWLPCCLFSLFQLNGRLRPNIIAICSLYIVIEKNSQEKNADEVEYLGDSSVASQRTSREIAFDQSGDSTIAICAHAPDQHGYW
jgi:hypothetical protein